MSKYKAGDIVIEEGRETLYRIDSVTDTKYLYTVIRKDQTMEQTSMEIHHFESPITRLVTPLELALL